jgi:inositol polyphosphate 1-phosphatase
LGVINQPFFYESDDAFKSKIFWGASINGENHHNIADSSSDNSKKIAIISSAETRRATLESAGYKTVIANGAGYKILKVIENDASIYFLTKDSTFKWDTCAGQAILNAIGGDVIDLQASIKKKKPISLTYGESQDKCNKTGLIAYRSVTHLINLIPSFL